MDKFNISIFENKIFFQIVKEIKLFSKYQINYYDDLNQCIKDSEKGNHIVIFFEGNPSKNNEYNFPSIIISKSLKQSKLDSNNLNERLKMPFSILDFEKKIVSLIAKNKFKENSLINLRGYIINKNERKIKKDNLELQLSEKEIDFLILFSETKSPIKKNFVLDKVWHYSEKTETHTVETHIHRLRKKIFSKFGDNNFIKNNNKGYYI